MALILSGDTGPSFVQDAAMPAGSVIQVVQSTLTTTQISTTSSSWTSTGFSASITPSSASNKILATISTNGYSTGAGVFTIFRNSTNVNGGSSTNGLAICGVSGGGYAPICMVYLDSPATTSSVTYTLYYRNVSGTSYALLTDVGNVITLQEIVA